MKNWHFVAIAPFLAACLLGSCSISDQDRCANGFTYDPIVKACQALVDAAAGPDTASTAPGDDAGTSEAGSGPTFGSTCTKASECVSATTDYCVALPGSAGYCSKQKCSADCPSDYSCCNCAAFGLVVCLKSADASKATAAYGCTCS